MKKQLLLTISFFLFSFQLLSQEKGIILSDSSIIKKIEGDWYGTNIYPSCPSTCVYRTVKDNSANKLNVTIKDSIIILSERNRNTHYDDYSFYNIGKSHFKIYDNSSSYFSAKNIEQYIMYLRFDTSELNFNGLVSGSTYSKNPKRYYQLLLTAYNWENNGCYIPSQQTKVCESNISKIDAFSLYNDTLVYYNSIRPIIKYVFDNNLYVFKDIADTNNVLRIVNDSTLLFTKNSDSVFVNRINQVMINTNNTIIGNWKSTTNVNHYLNINFSNNIYNVETNINDTLTMGVDPKTPLNSISRLANFQYIKINGDSLNELFFYMINQEWLAPIWNVSQDYRLLDQIIPYKIVLLSNGLLMDVATGETFSKVDAVKDNSLSSLITLSKPLENLLQLHTELNLINAQVSIYDMKGTEFISTLSENNVIDISTLTSGIYILKLQTADNKLASFKFVK